MSTEPISPGLSPRKLQLVLRYIDANISKRLRLSNLAGAARLSTCHFAREFKQQMDLAPMQYVWRRRIELAKQALRTRAPMVSIAYDFGFSSQAHFSTAFKQVTGVTPTAFRLAVLSMAPGWLAWEMTKLMGETAICPLFGWALA